MIKLRDYQDAMMDAARAHMRAGTRRVLLVAPTGAGKRMMAVYTIARAAERGTRCSFLVHRQELLDQAVDTIEDHGLRCGIIKSGINPDHEQPIQVASVQTLAKRLDKVPLSDFLFVDEAHHARASTWEQITSAHTSAFVLGFTATPTRLDGKGLGKWFDAMVVGPSMRELIDSGHLADYRLFAPPPPNIEGVQTVAGDYNRAQLAAAVDRPKLVGDAVEHYRRYAMGTQAICFAVNILHSKHLAEAFCAAGIPARHADGETPRDERAMTLEDFTARRFTVLCNVDILGEGLDVAGIETVSCNRPTKSLTVYLQQIGRGLRVKPNGAKCTIIDHAGNSQRLGLPDEDRQWELTADKIKRRASGDVPIKICPACFAAQSPATRTCPECGQTFEVEASLPDREDGNLIEIDRATIQWKRRQEEWRAKTVEELTAIGVARGYRYPRAWAKHVIEARERKRA